MSNRTNLLQLIKEDSKSIDFYLSDINVKDFILDVKHTVSINQSNQGKEEIKKLIAHLSSLINE